MGIASGVGAVGCSAGAISVCEDAGAGRREGAGAGRCVQAQEEMEVGQGLIWGDWPVM